MRIASLAKKVGKGLFYATCSFGVAFTAGTVLAGWLMVRPRKSRDYDCIPELKRPVFFPGAGHEDFLAFDPRRYIKAVDNLLKEFAPRRPALPELGTQQQILKEQCGYKRACSVVAASRCLPAEQRQDAATSLLASACAIISA